MKFLQRERNGPLFWQPDLRQKKVTIEKPKAGDNRSDWERLITQIDVKETVKADLDMAASLYECREEGCRLACNLYG